MLGHQAPIGCIDYDPASGEIVTGDQAGRVCIWRPRDEARTAYTASVLSGDVPAKKIAGVVCRGGALAVVAWDDKLRLGDAGAGTLAAATPLPGQPKGLACAAADPRVRVIVTGTSILLISPAAAAPAVLAVPYGPTCVDISADGALVAVGGKDRKIHLYSAAGGALTAAGETREFGGELSAVALHPSGASVAGGDSVREVRLYGTAGADKAPLRVGRWVNHTTRVTALRWSPAGRHLLSLSTDRRLCVWSPDADAPLLSLDLANPTPFAAAAWVDENTVWTVGSDGIAIRRTLAL